MISSHIHQVVRITGSEATKLPTGNYSRTFTIQTVQGEVLELLLYAPTATQLFVIPEKGE